MVAKRLGRALGQRRLHLKYNNGTWHSLARKAAGDEATHKLRQAWHSLALALRRSGYTPA